MDSSSVPVAVDNQPSPRPPHSPPQLPLHPSAAASPSALAAPPALNHPPPYAEMIYAAITALNEKGGSSKIAIGKQIEQTYSILPANHSTLLTEHLHHLKNTGHLRMVKKSYKLPKSHAPVPETNNNDQDIKRPVGRPRKQPSVVLLPLHPSEAASPAAPADPPALNHPPPYTEVHALTAELQQVRDDRDRQVFALTAELQQVRDDRDRQVFALTALTAELQQVRDDRDRQVFALTRLLQMRNLRQH